MAPMMRHAQMSHTVQMDREVQQRLMSPAEKDTLYKGATRPHMIVCVCCVCACVCRSVCVCVWCGVVVCSRDSPQGVCSCKAAAAAPPARSRRRTRRRWTRCLR